MTPEELARVLQISVSPVVLISGIGLLLLSMTNRLGRVVDRSRMLSKETVTEGEDRRAQAYQIRILWRRAKLLTASIALAASSILCTGLLIICLFAGYLMKLPMEFLVELLFVLTLVLLISSLVLFIKDVTLTLKALQLEIRRHVH